MHDLCTIEVLCIVMGNHRYYYQPLLHHSPLLPLPPTTITMVCCTRVTRVVLVFSLGWCLALMLCSLTTRLLCAIAM